LPVSVVLLFVRTCLLTAIDNEAPRAARILGIDYADALTGFEFRGRHGTAVLKGIVVAVEYREAVEAVIEGFLDARAQAEEEARTIATLRMWKRFLIGLRIKERVATYEVEGEGDEEVPEEVQMSSQDDDDDGMESEEYIDDGAGGFFLE
jgi:xeroderma pigmentosum group C-complementing protein